MNTMAFCYVIFVFMSGLVPLDMCNGWNFPATTLSFLPQPRRWITSLQPYNRHRVQQRQAIAVEDDALAHNEDDQVQPESLQPQSLPKKQPSPPQQQQQDNYDPGYSSSRSRRQQYPQYLSSSGAVLDAVATLTQESCQLLGVKSIGVDYGLVKTGLAVTVGYEPKPVAIFRDLNSTELCDQIIYHAQMEQASRIIVGLPLHKNGTVAEQTNLTLVVAQELAKKTLECLGPEIPVLLWDERYTSKEAAARAHSEDPNRYLYGTLDADAACIILEHYYQSNGIGAHTVQLESSIRQQALESYRRKNEEAEQRIHDAFSERERKLQQRKESIARALQLEKEEMQNENNSQKSKKKRKKKRR